MQRLFQLSFFLLVLTITACSKPALIYKLSPEIQSTTSLQQNIKLISVSVVDKRAPQAKHNDLTFAKSDTNEAAALRKIVIEKLTQDGFKIISDPLLADLSLKFELEKLHTSIDSGILKANLESVVWLKLKAARKGHNLTKLFKTSRSQEVAIPVNSNDITGLTNQALSAQLSKLFSDPELLALSEKSPVETTETFIIEPSS